jgi:hypothetical protein
MSGSFLSANAAGELCGKRRADDEMVQLPSGYQIRSGHCNIVKRFSMGLWVVGCWLWVVGCEFLVEGEIAENS